MILPPDVILVLAKNVVAGGVDREYVEDNRDVVPSPLLVEDSGGVVGWGDEVGVGISEVGVVDVVWQDRAKSVCVGKVTKDSAVSTTCLVSTIVVTPPISGVAMHQLVAEGETRGANPVKTRNAPLITVVDVKVTGVHVDAVVMPPVPTVNLIGPQLDVVTTKVVVLSGRLEVSVVVVVSVRKTVLVDDPGADVSCWAEEVVS
jgi:hypothetical protein